MISSFRGVRVLAAILAVSLPFVLSACGGDDTSAMDTSAAPDCPTTPVNVVVSVDQWGNIVSQLGGACAEVTTVLAGSAVDPHDYEPAPSDAADFEGAQLVVLNGGHYDEWAAKLAATSAADAPVVNAVELSGGHAEQGQEHAGEDGHGHAEEGQEHAGEQGQELGDEGNPHVWYNPTAVTEVAEAVTAQLGKLSPDAAGYFAERHAEFAESMKPYDEVIAAIKAGATGRTYAATESVFGDMATALGLVDRTPQGYQVAAANESDPSPADLDAFLQLLADRGVDVLIYNTQTEGSVPEQIRSAAEQAGIAVVDVTETLPSDAKSFQDWQVAQLDSLAKALDVRT
ncbi:metal ABC transporter solute-binding protein, Zn/Mn family [Mycolicibacterium austroafricanum]|uniref:metal ABC transporter solute-binding protein, Zn/Mn family n=1 Tax=Mycolicibacterium austroafricanum TaxID=39687 RepID=UPI000B27221C|nr:zinc ABC transporter substrate-binding protein [Mycolicibacterium austroafricanum]QZY45627.1 zinc ABC transporter substrate-binding protein [Mycolicibacterium austroafricanum]